MLPKDPKRPRKEDDDDDDGDEGDERNKRQKTTSPGSGPGHKPSNLLPPTSNTPTDSRSPDEPFTENTGILAAWYPQLFGASPSTHASMAKPAVEVEFGFGRLGPDTPVATPSLLGANVGPTSVPSTPTHVRPPIPIRGFASLIAGLPTPAPVTSSSPPSSPSLPQPSLRPPHRPATPPIQRAWSISPPPRTIRTPGYGNSPFPWIDLGPVDPADRADVWREWLASSRNWDKGALTTAGGWRGVRVLGEGCYGAAGHWRRTYRDEVDSITKQEDIVIKQAQNNSEDSTIIPSLFTESNLLQQLKQRNVLHTIRLLKPAYMDVGVASSDMEGVTGLEFNTEGGDCARMGLEYCDAGDFGGFMKRMYNKYPRQNPLPEDKIWQVFECLARGLLNMEKGMDIVDGEAWDRERIYHGDIKPDNRVV